jgi:hypothetical protein
MSHLLIQQDELVNQFGGDMELTALISHFESEFEKKGEVVCRVRINDLPLNEAEEIKFGTTPLKLIQSFEIETENPNQLLVDVIFRWQHELPNLITLTDQVSDRVRFDGLEKSYLQFSKLIDACHWFVSSLTSIRTLLTEKNMGDLEKWNEAEKKLWRAFDDLMSAFNSKNSNLIADIIEYELATTLHAWLTLFNIIQETI